MREERRNEEKIAFDIMEHSPSVALRICDPPDGGAWVTLFVTDNIKTFGYTKEELYSGSCSFKEIIHPEDRAGVLQTMEKYAEQGVDKYSLSYRILKKNGEAVWVLDASTVCRDEKGNLLYSDCILSDYTEFREYQDRLEDGLRRQQVLNDILQSLHDSDVDKAFEIILDRAGVYLGVSRVVLFEDFEDHSGCRAVYEWDNAGIARMMDEGLYLNYKEDIPDIEADLTGEGVSIIHHGAIPPDSAGEFEKEGVITAAIYSVYLPDDRYGFICFDECTLPRSWDENTREFLKNIASLTSTALIRKHNAQAIEKMAYRDQLTGLTNRYRFEIDLEQALARARQGGGTGHVLFVDLDDFKIINDVYGHDYGDAMLREVAAFFREEFADEVSLCRFGGDEFVLLVPPESAAGIQPAVDAILARAQNPWPVLDKKFYCTVSVGVVAFPKDGKTGKEVIQNADIAMHQAKKQGKNSFVRYNAALDVESISRAETESRLRHAIDNNFAGFEVYYQPMVNSNGAVKGAEALIRWVDKEGNLLGPGAFIELAEYLGLILPLGEFVLQNAATECRKANEKLPEFTMSVNVSVRQFQQPDFVSRVRTILAESGVDPANIILEVTEGLAIQDLHQMKRILGELRMMGIKVALDDFGTGYSSLNNMREIPLDIIKIDRSFVQDIATDAYSKTFVRLITDLCHSMGRAVCVEGVETREQLRYCVQFEADYIQGFYFWTPMPAGNLRALLLEENAFPVEL